VEHVAHFKDLRNCKPVLLDRNLAAMRPATDVDAGKTASQEILEGDA
jgi:hypothetical protein